VFQQQVTQTKGPDVRTLSLRRNFAWSLAGNFTYNMVQWVLVVVLARLGTKEMVGQFALAQALSAPVFLTVGLNLRVVRATDVRRRWSTGQYRQLRLALNAVSIVVALGIGLAFGLSQNALLVLLMICLGKSAEATSQTLYGFFQLRDRLDLVSRSLLLRALLGSVGFVVALVITDGLVEACAAMAAGWTLTYLLHDVRHEAALLRTDDPPARRTEDPPGTLWSLARKAAPLGVDAGVGSLATNTPRYAVQHLLGTGQLGAFAALAYLAQVVAMITGALADSVIGRLAREADRRDHRAFVRTLGILVAFGAAVSTVAGLLALVLGGPVIRALLGAEYVNQPVLVLLMAGAGLVTLQRCLGRGLQAAHRFTGVLAVDVLTLAGTVAAAVVLIPAFGLRGAAATLGLGFGVGCLLAVVLLVGVVREMRGARLAPTTSGGA
jgi:O-antigen/teichoic acid export membrane protein